MHGKIMAYENLKSWNLKINEKSWKNNGILTWACFLNFNMTKKFFAGFTRSTIFKNQFLAHLSRRLIWWACRIGRPPSSVVVRRRHSLNIFSSETTRLVKVKFHMELLWDRGTKVCSNDPDHMTRMAAMPIYGKNLKKSSSLEPKGRWPWNIVCIIRCPSTTKFAQMMTLGWPWHILQQG